jgi:TonB family protein
MSKLAILALSLSAFATTSSLLEPTTGAGTKVRLDLTTTKAAATVFPSVVEPAVPSVDRIAHSIRARLGSTAIAELELCVSPAGNVTKVALAKTSTFEAFDAALVRDAEAWRFAAMPGPASLQSCRRARIAYQTR